MPIKSPHKLSLFSLIMVSSAFVTSVRNLPTIAETGMHMFLFALIAAICYFIPVALVSAELATGWPKLGGVYVWVREAFGDRLGFVAVWLQWTYMTISVIAMLYFVGGSLAYVINPQLAQDRSFLIAVNLIVIWLFTALSLRGLKTSALISSIGFITGVLIPGALIIVLGIVYLVVGDPVQLNTQLTVANLVPNLHQLAGMVLLVGFMRAFAGIEASASHANHVKNPQRNYPIAIFVVVVIGLCINILGSLSVAVVVPQAHISLISGLMSAFEVFFATFHMKFLLPVLALMVTCGAVGGISTWLMGPVKGLLATAEYGELPPFLQKTNKNGSPRNLLIIQAVVISIVSTVLLSFPSINLAFWISVALSVMIYMTMYSLMLLSGIRLRYKQPNVVRKYRIPGGHIGMNLIAGLGVLTMVFVFIIALFPPSELPGGNHTLYISILAISIVVLLSLPFIIYALRKPEWRSKHATTD